MTKILIVEDEENIARFVELELGYEGYERKENVMTVGEGLAMIKERTYDLVLLDIMLPRLNGMEILRRMRQFTDTPVIMLTARDRLFSTKWPVSTVVPMIISQTLAIEELLHGPGSFA